MIPTMRGIVEGWLREAGFDGLVSGAGACGCPIGDIGPCGCLSDYCEAAFAFRCYECTKAKTCDKWRDIIDEPDVVYSTDREFCDPYYLSKTD